MPTSTSTKLSRLQRVRRARPGYTMIELMIVVAIIGSIFTLTYQLSKTFISSKIAAVTPQEISALASHAREKAMASGETLTLEFNLDKRSMGLRSFDPAIETVGEPPPARYDLDEDESDGKNWIFEGIDFPSDLTAFYSVSGVELSGPYIYFHFYPNGSSDSIIFFYEGREKPYYYISRYNVPGVELDDLRWQYLDANLMP